MAYIKHLSLKAVFATLLFTLSTGLLGSFPSQADSGETVVNSPMKLPQSIVPGQLVVATAPVGSEVRVNGKPVAVGKQGVYVFGVGRDAVKPVTVSIHYQGETRETKLPINIRQYKTDDIKGIEKKYVSPPKKVLARIKNDNKQIGIARATQSQRVDFLAPIVWPATGRISGVFGSQRIFNGVPKRPHFGLDIANKTGEPVVAPWAGKVVLAVNDMYYSGGTLIIDHGFGVTTTYIHLSKITVKKGQVITQGEKIAEIGATGRVTGPHLDWRINWLKERLDPALLFSEKGIPMNAQVVANQTTPL